MKLLVQSPRALGRAIREARNRRGLTQSQLAEKIGSSQPTVSQIERGHAITVATLLRLLAALRLELIIQDRSPAEVTGPWDEEPSS